MQAIQTTKMIPVILPAAIVDDGAFTSNVIDLNDFDGAGYIEFVGIIGGIDADMTQLRVMESDTKSDATTLGGTPALVKGATTLPTAAGADNQMFVFGIDLRSPRERYLQLQATAGDGASGTFLAAFAMAEPGRASSVAANRGLLFAEYAQLFHVPGLQPVFLCKPRAGASRPGGLGREAMTDERLEMRHGR